MDFGFLYDRQRKLFAIGYRLADAEGPGRLDESSYDLLASEARLASFWAIAKEDVPQEHWFHLGRPLTSVDGQAALLSWSATLFEYLMPMLLMRSYPDTLLDRACRLAVRHQQQYAAARRVPWGISESAFNLGGTTGPLPVQGLRRPGPRYEARPEGRTRRRPVRDGPRDDGGAATAAHNLDQLVERGLVGRYGHYEAVDFTPRSDDPRASRGQTAGRSCELPGPPPGHDPRRPGQRPHGDAMVRRFHADPRVQATELLLQERVPRAARSTPPRPAEETRVATPGPRRSHATRPSPHTPLAARPFPFQRRLHRRSTNAGGGASLLARARSPAGERTGPATREASSCTSATCRRASSGPPRTSPWPCRPTTTGSPSVPRR